MDNQQLLSIGNSEAEADNSASFAVYLQQPSISYYGAFMVGVVTGAVALGVTVSVIKNLKTVKGILPEDDKGGRSKCSAISIISKTKNT